MPITMVSPKAAILSTSLLIYTRAFTHSGVRLASRYSPWDFKASQLKDVSKRNLWGALDRLSSNRGVHTTSKDTDNDTSSVSSAGSAKSTSSYFVKPAAKKAAIQTEYFSVPKSWRSNYATLITAVGFGASSVSSLYANRNQLQLVEKSMVQIEEFLKKSEIDEEIVNVLSSKLIDHLVILGRIQQFISKGRDPRELAALPSVSDDASIPSASEALRYAKYAVSAYGDSVIRATRLDVLGDYDFRIFGEEDDISRGRIAEHVGIQNDDIAVMDVSYSGCSKNLRHFVAVDHKNQKVVLAIRGTFSLSEVIVDVAAFSRPFCEGQAHSEMATMAETIWELTGPKVMEVLEKNPGYGFVITGHSLGAGTASLLNILCHHKKLVGERKIQCVTFASPPVFEPLEKAPDAVNAATNFIHGDDCVPFLSVDSIRHTLACLAAITEGSETSTFFSRMSMAMGYQTLSSALVKNVQAADQIRPLPKQKAPILYIPAANNVWIRDGDGKEAPNTVFCDSTKIATQAIQIKTKMMTDHFPQRYEHVLHRLCESNSEV